MVRRGDSTDLGTKDVSQGSDFSNCVDTGGELGQDYIGSWEQTVCVLSQCCIR